MATVNVTIEIPEAAQKSVLEVFGDAGNVKRFLVGALHNRILEAKREEALSGVGDLPELGQIK